MNRIDQLFREKDSDILSVYFTAGYPELHDTRHIIQGLEKSGADLVEIGFPFSDPVADGPVIQASSHKALENGMNLDILFAQLAEIRNSSSIPKILMGYFNVVYQFGMDGFIERCSEAGIDGLIIPDLPPEIYQLEYQRIVESAGIHFICLVSPQTPAGRIRYLSGISRGFLYLLSSSSTTGQFLDSDSSRDLPDWRGKKSSGKPSNPVELPALIGFGIHDRSTFRMACDHASGGIVGSEFIRRLGSIPVPEAGVRLEPEFREKQIYAVCRRFVEDVRGKK